MHLCTFVASIGSLLPPPGTSFCDIMRACGGQLAAGADLAAAAAPRLGEFHGW